VVDPLIQIAAKKTIHDRRIVVRHFDSEKDYQQCHLLYIPDQPSKAEGGSADKRLNDIMEKVKGKPVLLVGESDGLAVKGAMLNFYLDGGKVKFEVNLDAAKAAGLQMHSQLLQLGKPVAPPTK
jgi:hypothetical protein